MKIYRDQAHTIELKPNEEFRFDRIDAGDTRQETLYITNDSNGELMNITFEIEDKNNELKVLNFPKWMKPHTNGEVSIEIKSRLDIEEKISGILKYHADKILS